jgi:hypothetical protein
MTRQEIKDVYVAWFQRVVTCTNTMEQIDSMIDLGVSLGYLKPDDNVIKLKPKRKKAS